MTMFVGDNPVIMSGSIVAIRGEKVVLGDGRGNTLIFDWNGEQSARVHGSPSDVVIELPAQGLERPSGACVQCHIEGKAVQVRYAVEPVDADYCVISYTMCEDIRELLIEAEAPSLAHMDAHAGVRMGIGPDR